MLSSQLADLLVTIRPLPQATHQSTFAVQERIKKKQCLDLDIIGEYAVGLCKFVLIRHELCRFVVIRVDLHRFA